MVRYIVWYIVRCIFLHVTLEVHSEERVEELERRLGRFQRAVGLQLEALLTGTPSSAGLDPSMLPVYVTDLGSIPAADAPIVERASLKRRFSRILSAAGSDAGSAATASAYASRSEGAPRDRA